MQPKEFNDQGKSPWKVAGRLVRQKLQENNGVSRTRLCLRTAPPVLFVNISASRLDINSQCVSQCAADNDLVS